MAELVNTFQRTTSSERLEVIDEADAALQDFKKFMEETYPKASSLYETAKWLWQDVHDLRTKKQVDDAQVAALFEKQSEKWSKLELEATEMQDLIKNKYASVASAEERIKKARGSGASRAVFGFPTPDQKEARYVFDKKLKYKFHDAKSEISMMCDFPDGMLVQVRLLHKATETMAEVGDEPTPKPESPKPEAPHLDVTDKADVILQEFKKFMEETYPKASSLYERGKWLYQEVHDLRTKKAPDIEVVALLEHQAETWTRLVKDEAALRKSIDAEFNKVLDIEDRVKKARGQYPNVAALGFPTPDQRLARHMYSRKFKFAFHDAKDEYGLFCGFPDGILTKTQKLNQLVHSTEVAGPAAEAVDTPAAE